MNRTFKDHFSGHADDYGRYRPTYPGELFDWLASVAPGRTLAWDAACGSGQAARDLAARFTHVVANDASARQIAQAAPHPSVSYFVARAGASGLASGVADLVTVAQAAHWFDMDAFSKEARRVLRPGGVVAVWCYGLAAVTPEVDRVVRQFYDGTLDGYWPPERAHVEGAYRDLHFPFRELDPPAFVMAASWSLDDFLGYLGTWSAYRRYIQERDDPLPALGAELESVWGTGERSVRWPLHIRAGIADR